MPPYIVNQPTNQTKAIGRTATFKVVAGGEGALSYQWRFNGNELEDATTDALTLFNVQPVQAGGYSVVVSNAYGSTSSIPAILTVLIPTNNLVLLAPNGSPNSPFTFIVSGDAGHIYAVEMTTNFQAWTELTTISNQTGQVEFTDPAASNSVRRFYRARLAQ